MGHYSNIHWLLVHLLTRWHTSTLPGVRMRIVPLFALKDPGTQTADSQRFSKTRFPRGGESHIHNSLRDNILGAREIDNNMDISSGRIPQHHPKHHQLRCPHVRPSDRLMLSPDPLAHKYTSWSPYAYCAAYCAERS